MALNIISMWEFSSGGNLVDSAPAANTLTNFGSVTFGTGLVGDCPSFSGSNMLYSLTNASLETGDIDYYVSYWINPTNLTGLHCAGAKAQVGQEWRLLSSGTTLLWQVYGPGGQVGEVSLSISTGSWQLIEVYHSATLNEVGIAINGGAFVTAGTSGPAGSTSDPFAIGGLFVDFLWIGLIDQFIFSKGIPTTDERIFIYNGAAGRTYAELTTAAAYALDLQSTTYAITGADMSMVHTPAAVTYTLMGAALT